MATKKKGRKQKHHEAADGSTVVGLSKMKDGRWRIIGTQVRFSEPDENKAIEKFEKLTGKKLPVGGRLETHLNDDGSTRPEAVARYNNGFAIMFRNEADYWRQVAKDIFERPKYVAQMTGREEIGYLNKLEAPAPLPSFDDLKQTYKEHATCKDPQKVIRAFDDFLATTGAKELPDITVPLATSFKDAVQKRAISDKQRGHIFAGVKTLLRFIRERGVAVHEISRALESMVTLKKKKMPVKLDPKPISRENWDKLLKAALTPADKAMILLMLNCALYVEDYRNLKWDDFRDGCLVARREKRGNRLRVAPLWQETIEAMEALPRIKGINHLFLNYAGAPLGRSGGQKRFNDLADAAGIGHITGSHLRDSASTAAVEGNVSSDLRKLMMGHRCGIEDHYVLASPKMVKPATDAVHAKYLA